MSRETKIGIFVFLVLITMTWGYTFLKGRNLLTTANELYTTYDDVTDLTVSSPVLVNGFKIGSVTKIKLNPDDVKKMDVYYLIDKKFKVPKNATASLKSMGFVGGKGIFLEFEKECQGADCAETGDRITGKSLGLLGSMVGDAELSEYGTELSTTVRNIVSNIGKEGEIGPLNETIRQLEVIAKNIADISASTKNLIGVSSNDISATMRHLNTLSGALAGSNEKIEGIFSNLNKITKDMSDSDLSKTISETNETLSASKEAITELKTTLSNASETMQELSKFLKMADNENGSIAKLMKDKGLYDNLEASTRNLSLLLQDLRLNPKRYAHFSLFGKKQSTYILPTEDPALLLEE